MTYFTSWDANVFLCLVTWGIPGDVVKGMLKMTKKVHQEFTLGESLSYWNTNSPRMLPRTSSGWCRFQINENLSFRYKWNAWPCNHGYFK